MSTMRNEVSNSDTVLQLENISLSFGGVKALTNISFDVKQHEIRSIIGPNGAGKSSMLNVINGVYHPQAGDIYFRGEKRKQMNPAQAARQGIARTFQNIALFKGMTVLDNIMTGRNTKMNCSFLSNAIWVGKARAEEELNRHKVEEVIDFLEIHVYFCAFIWAYNHSRWYWCRSRFIYDAMALFRREHRVDGVWYLCG